MSVFIFILIGILIFICILIIASILLQEDKSGGGIGALGGSSQSFFGASSGSILAKFTSVLLVLFILIGVAVAIISSRFTSETMIKSEDINRVEYSNIKAKITEVKKMILNQMIQRMIINK